MIDDRTRQLRVDGFRKAEASLRLEGMDPSGTPLYESVKARILSGEITYGEGRAEILAHYQKRADRKCFVITAAPRRRQNSGTRCVFGVPPARQILLVRLRPTPARYSGSSSLNPTPLAIFLPRLAAWPTPHARTVNCAPVHRYPRSLVPEIRS